MKLQLPSWNDFQQENFKELETRLKTTLIPVTPRAGFIQSLERKLITASISQESGSGNSSDTSQYIILSLASVASGLLLIMTGVRAVVTIVGAIGILHQAHRKLNNRGRQSPLKTAM